MTTPVPAKGSQTATRLLGERGSGDNPTARQRSNEPDAKTWSIDPDGQPAVASAT
ncbi:MAG: hypothetical protein P1U77_04800 [Rubripirellula sp.]|nr:hypothetical protein [Rubripirellula sp.]